MQHLSWQPKRKQYLKVFCRWWNIFRPTVTSYHAASIMTTEKKAIFKSFLSSKTIFSPNTTILPGWGLPEVHPAPVNPAVWLAEVLDPQGGERAGVLLEPGNTRWPGPFNKNGPRMSIKERVNVFKMVMVCITPKISTKKSKGKMSL